MSMPKKAIEKRGLTPFIPFIQRKPVSQREENRRLITVCNLLLVFIRKVTAAYLKKTRHATGLLMLQ